jgi:hypothetical protein
MANILVTALAQNITTFTEARTFLFYALGNSRDKVIQLENASVDTCIPYYIAFIESKGININEAINCFAYDVPNSKYWELLKITVVNTFRKIENNDYNFIPF